MEQYKNADGTYTSPKNGKTYKSLKAFNSHWYYAGHVRSDVFAKRLYNVKCQYCSSEMVVSNYKRHEAACYLNPHNIKLCEVCSSPIKNFKTSKGTCSKGCANTYFKSGENNGNWKQDAYRSTCFLYHKKECLVCMESNIVEAHHLDENRSNNDPSNLVPLCPTHHQYWHSRYRHLIEEKVYSYIKEWMSNLSSKTKID